MFVLYSKLPEQQKGFNMIKALNTIIIFDKLVWRFRETKMFKPYPNQLYIQEGFNMRRYLYDALTILTCQYKMNDLELSNLNQLYCDKQLFDYLLLAEIVNKAGYIERLHFGDKSLNPIFECRSEAIDVDNEKSNKWKSCLIMDKKDIEISNELNIMVNKKKNNNPLVLLEIEDMRKEFYSDISRVDTQVIFICKDIDKAASLINTAYKSN